MTRNVLVLLALLASGCVTAPQVPPAMELQTWGAPWTRRVEVTVRADGRVSVGIDDPRKGSAGRRTVSFSLSPAELTSLRDTARSALASSVGAGRHETVEPDATWVRLVLSGEAGAPECTLRAAGRAQSASPDISRLLDQLNRHLAPDDQIW